MKEDEVGSTSQNRRRLQKGGSRRLKSSALIIFGVAIGWCISSAFTKQSSIFLFPEMEDFDPLSFLGDGATSSSLSANKSVAPITQQELPTTRAADVRNSSEKMASSPKVLEESEKTNPVPLSSIYFEPLKPSDELDFRHQGPDLSAMNETIEAVALDEQGTLGYVADPFYVRRAVFHFLEQRNMLQASLTDQYFDVMVNYDIQNGARTNETRYSVDMPSTCSEPAGKGSEKSGAEILSKKLQVYKDLLNQSSSSSLNTSNSTRKRPRLLCMMYTYDKKRDPARAAVLSWGIKCDGIIVFSTKTIPSLGMVNLSHYGPEAYDNMWQKVRSIWGYVGKHYLNQFDYFHLCGDDTFLIVENLRKFIHRLEATYPRDKKIFTGAMIANGRNARRYIHGGTGYTMNRAAAFWFISEQLPTYSSRKRTSAEDRHVSFAFADKGISYTDSRDPETGEQLYHPFNAYTLYRKKKGSLLDIWASQSHPSRANETVGPKRGLEMASKDSVGFHHVKRPSDIARYNALIYKICPKGTGLGDTLI